jgi:hypothetical protein
MIRNYLGFPFPIHYSGDHRIGGKSQGLDGANASVLRLRRRGELGEFPEPLRGYLAWSRPATLRF